ncbi:MAG: HPF/RaiA family ribosome-associated protein [Candidatus Aminicenantes bacterium]|nr:HPF/RaiA family ribosome-associated protein [Candidatus Aminicenantes bacterium]
MSINFTSKNVKFTGALKAYAEKQLRDIERISGDIIDAEMIVSEEKLDFKVELALKTRLHSYHIEDRDSILKQALRSVLNTLKAQAKKNKEKLKKEKKRKNKGNIFKMFAAMGGEPAESRDSKEAAGVSQLTVCDNFSRKPLSVEEAIFFLKESGENAYLFQNAETNKTAVVFFNKEKNISIIEADIKR